MNAVHRLAIVVLLLGAVLLAGPMFGFSSINADRGVSVETAAAPDAHLGINATNTTVRVAGNDDAPQEIGTLTNNLDETATIAVAVEHIPNGNDSILQANPDGVNVDPGSSTTATVECAEGTTLNERDVVFRAQTDGSAVRVENATFTVTIDIQCGQGSGQIDTTNSGLAGVSASNLTDGDPNQVQTIAFDLTEDLQSGETVTITLYDVQKNKRLDYTGASFTADASGSLTTGPVGGHDYEIVFEANDTIGSGETVTITADGVDASGSQAAKSAPYGVEFQRSDKPDPEDDSFDVN